MNRDLITIVVGKGLQVLSMVAALRILTMQLQPEEMGKYAIYMTLILLFSSLFLLPMGIYTKRFLHEWVDNQIVRSRMILLLLYLLLVITALSLFFLLPWGQLVPKWQVTSFWLIVLVSGTMLLKTINEALQMYFNMLNMRITWAVFALLTVWSGLLISWFLTNHKPSAELWILGQLLGHAIFAVLALYPFFKTSIPSVTKATIKLSNIQITKIFSFALPICIAIVLSWVQFSSYRLLLGQYTTLATLGFFVAGYSVSSGIMMAYETSVQQYFNPLFYKSISAKDENTIRDTWQQYADCIIPMLIITTAFICFYAKPIMTLLVDPKYWQASNFVIVAAFVEGMRVLGNVYVEAAHATLKTKLLIMPQAIGAILVSALVPLGLIFYGVEALVPVIIFAGIVYVGILHFMITRSCKLKVSFAHWEKVMLAILLFAIAARVELIQGSLIFNSVMQLFMAGLVYLGINYYILRNSIWMKPIDVSASQQPSLS